MARIIRLLALFAVLAAIIGGIVWAANIGTPIKDWIYHPQGSSTSWLDARYARGFTSWTTKDDVIGLSADRQTVLLSSGSRIRYGVDVYTGQEKWRTTASECYSAGQVFEGFAYCLSTERSVSKIIRLDISTGDSELLYQASFKIQNILVPMRYRDQLVIWMRDSAGGRLVSFTQTGAINWETPLPGMTRCAMLGEYIGCDSDEEYGVVSAADGTTTLPLRVLDGANHEYIIWATDGYIIARGRLEEISNKDFTRPSYDFAGKKLDDVQNPAAPIFPGRGEGVHYPLADYSYGKRKARVVDAAGTVVASREYYNNGDPKTRLHPAGRLLTGEIAAVSADGKVVLRDGGYKTDQKIILFSRDGDEIGSLGRFHTTLKLKDGLIVDFQYGAALSTVYAPKP